MRKLFFVVVAISFLLVWRVGASGQLPEIQNMQALGQEALDRNLPVLILFSIADCPYCDFIREDYLIPMLDDPSYKQKIIIREIYMDSLRYIRDFEGNQVEPMNLAQHYQATLAPTLVFIDGKGRQLVEKMVGVTTPDFYGGYLDRAIFQSYERLRELVYSQPID